MNLVRSGWNPGSARTPYQDTSSSSFPERQPVLLYVHTQSASHVNKAALCTNKMLNSVRSKPVVVVLEHSVYPYLLSVLLLWWWQLTSMRRPWNGRVCVLPAYQQQWVWSQVSWCKMSSSKISLHHVTWHGHEPQCIRVFTVYVCTCFVFQVSVKVRHCQLLSWLQCHAGLFPHHGHESQPPVQWRPLQETTGGVQGECLWFVLWCGPDLLFIAILPLLWWAANWES